MEHLPVLLYALAFAVGGAALTLVGQRLRVLRHTLFRDYLRFLLLLNLCVAFNLVASYLENVLAPGFPVSAASPVAVILDLVGMVLVAGIAHTTIKVMHTVLGEATPRALGTIVLVAVITVSLGLLAAALLLSASEADLDLHAVPRAANLVALTAAAAFTVRTLAMAGRLNGPDHAAVRRFAGLHFAMLLLILSGFFAPRSVAWHLLAVAFLGFNVSPFVALREGVARHLSWHRPVEAIAANLSGFAAQYGISAREGQIVCQLLTGSTNSEIARTFSISASTVKNHIHNIYVKCGVRNRVELTSLVHRLQESAEP